MKYERPFTFRYCLIKNNSAPLRNIRVEVANLDMMVGSQTAPATDPSEHVATEDSTSRSQTAPASDPSEHVATEDSTSRSQTAPASDPSEHVATEDSTSRSQTAPASDPSEHVATEDSTSRSQTAPASDPSEHVATEDSTSRSQTAPASDPSEHVATEDSTSRSQTAPASDPSEHVATEDSTSRSQTAPASDPSEHVATEDSTSRSQTAPASDPSEHVATEDSTSRSQTAPVSDPSGISGDSLDSLGQASNAVTPSPLISSVFSGVGDLKRQLLISPAVADYMWQKRDKLSFKRPPDGSGIGGKVLCAHCERNFSAKLRLYKELFPARTNVYSRIGVFELSWTSIKLSTIKKHFESQFCTVLDISDVSQCTDKESGVSALQSLILLCIHQCKNHLPALGTRGLVQWGVLSGLNEDIIQGFGVTPNFKMRLMIGRYCLSEVFTSIESGKIKYLHVGTDSQKMNFQQKWVNFFIRFAIDGVPVTSTLGVLRVFGQSTGVALRQLFEDIVTGKHLQSVIQTGQYLHEPSEDESDNQAESDEAVRPLHMMKKLELCGIKLGMDWNKFLESLVSSSTDGGSDFAGIHTGFTGLLTREVTTHTLNSYWCSNHVWDLISADLSSNPTVPIFKFSEEFFSDLAKRCRASTLFKDFLEERLSKNGIRPFSFCVKLDGRWEMSEYEILKKMMTSMPVLVRLRDPDDNTAYLYNEIRRIVSIYICAVIREINVTCLVEPAEQHILNPVLLFRMVEDCTSQYNDIIRGTVPEKITALFDGLTFRQEQLYDNSGRLLRGQFEESIFCFPINGQGVLLKDTLGQPVISNESHLKDFVFGEMKKVARILLIKLKGGDHRNEPGEVFSNWDYVRLAASCMDNRKFSKRPDDFFDRPAAEQEDLKRNAVQKKMGDFLLLMDQRKDIIGRKEDIEVTAKLAETSWKTFVTHVYTEYDDIQSMDYYEFWVKVHQDTVLQQDCKVVLALNSIVNTECGSNATAEHLGHMSNLITQKQRERLKPLRASDEMIISYMMPTLPDVVDLGLHKKLAQLWIKIGGRNPVGSKGTVFHKKRNILQQRLKRPAPKRGRKTKYFKRKLHQYESNLRKVMFFKS